MVLVAEIPRPPLPCAIGAGRQPLDVAVVRDGDHHVLLADQRLLVVVADLLVGDHAPPRVGVPGLQLAEVGADDVEDQPLVGEDPLVAGDVPLEADVFLRQLVGLQAGQALELHGEDGVGLHPGQPGGLLGLGVVEGAAEDLGRDGHHHQPGAGLRRVGRGADHPDDLVDVRQRDQQPLDDVGPLPRLAELVLRPPADHVDPVLDEQPEQVLQRQRPGPAVDQGQHDHAEAVLQRRVLEELVDDDVGVLALLDGDDDPHRLVAVAEVVDVGHAGDPAAVDQLGELLEQDFLGELVGDLGEGDVGAAVLELLDVVLGPEDHPAAAGAIGLAQAVLVADRRPGGEVGAGDDLHQLVELDRRVVDVGDQGVADLAEVVRRDRRRHAHRDAAGAVDQQVGELAGQDPRLLVLLVVVGLEVDGVELDVLEHLGGDRAELGLGVPHRRRRQAVDAAEVPLPGDQQVPHVPPLGHAGQRRIDRIIPVRVVALHRLADDARALAGGAARAEPQVAHRHQDPPLRRLQPVADVGQRPADDHRHRIIEVAFLELFLDVQRLGRSRSGGGQDGGAHGRSVPLYQVGSRNPSASASHRHAACFSKHSFYPKRPRHATAAAGGAEYISRDATTAFVATPAASRGGHGFPGGRRRGATSVSAPGPFPRPPGRTRREGGGPSSRAPRPIGELSQPCCFPRHNVLSNAMGT